jgi:antitoxin component of MazEF toxin-antitoxin module
MVSRVFKQGSRLTLEIPRNTAKAKRLRAGDKIEFTIEIVRVTRKRPTVKGLIKGMTKSNRHAETNWGKPVGKEFR